MTTKSFIKTIGEKGLLADYNTEGKKLQTEDSIDQTYSSTSTKAQSGVAVNEAFKTRETSTRDNSYTYLGMNKIYTGTEEQYWKLVSFNTVNNYWAFQFEVDVSNGRKSNGSYDTEIYETKRLTISGTKLGKVSYALEMRFAAQGIDSKRGYSNNIYYEVSDSNLVTVYIKAIDKPNQTQVCRLKDVINFQNISNITWHKATNNAGTQPINPIKFTEKFPAISSSDIGSDSVPVYVNKGKPVACNSSNLKAGKDDDGNVIKNTYQKKLIAGDNITIDGSTISSDQVFVAKYGITTYKEIKDAYDAGKICTVFNNEFYYLINLINTEKIRFITQSPNPSIPTVEVSSNDRWSSSTTWLQSRLTFDTAPKAGSKNPVTSEGIRTMQPLSHRFDNETSSRLILWGKADNEGYIHDMIRKFGLQYGYMTEFLFSNSVHKDNTTSVSINILNASSIPATSTKRLKASIFKDASENSYFALWLDGSISQPGAASYADYYPDVAEQETFVSHFTVFNPSEYTLVRDLTIKYRPLALPIQSAGVLTSDGSYNSWLTPPTSGTAVLKSVNGVLQWVTE